MNLVTVTYHIQGQPKGFVYQYISPKERQILYDTDNDNTGCFLLINFDQLTPNLIRSEYKPGSLMKISPRVTDMM